jgi:hypothetical protein
LFLEKTWIKYRSTTTGGPAPHHHRGTRLPSADPEDAIELEKTFRFNYDSITRGSTFPYHPAGARRAGSPTCRRTPEVLISEKTLGASSFPPLSHRAHLPNSLAVTGTLAQGNHPFSVKSAVLPHLTIKSPTSLW